MGTILLMSRSTPTLSQPVLTTDTPSTTKMPTPLSTSTPKSTPSTHSLPVTLTTTTLSQRSLSRPTTSTITTTTLTPMCTTPTCTTKSMMPTTSQPTTTTRVTHTTQLTMPPTHRSLTLQLTKLSTRFLTTVAFTCTKKFPTDMGTDSSSDNKKQIISSHK